MPARPTNSTVSCAAGEAMELKDRVAVITGGGGGIGSAVDRKWKAEGARGVVVVDRNEEAAQKVGEEIGGRGLGLAGPDEQAIIARVDRVENDMAPIDICFCNAAAGGAGGIVNSYDEA